MPTVLGPGDAKSVEMAEDGSVKGVAVSKSKSGVTGFVVPWGYYYYNHGNDHTREMATDAMNSCFAVICSYDRGKKVFFAHVSSDGEAAHIVKAIKRVNPSRDDNYTCIIVLGQTPQSTTLKRVNTILAEAQYGFHVYQSSEGAVSYNSLTGELSFGATAVGECIVSRGDRNKAMWKATQKPLNPMEGSLDLDSQ
ncbi:Hypothetical protein A7982_11885 [Minicystis rosea]|nr:Hypothetical protein A7982_11885 [Minicystis rosea]